MARLLAYLKAWNTPTERHRNKTADLGRGESSGPGQFASPYYPGSSKEAELEPKNNGPLLGPLLAELPPLEAPASTPDTAGVEPPLLANLDALVPPKTGRTPEATSPAKPGFAERIGSMTIKEILAHLGDMFPMDEAVVEALPAGRTFVWVEHFGTSAWTITGKVTARSADGSEECYFVKIAYGETGKVMLGGEYESSKAIYEIVPDFIPKPIGYGRYRAPGPETYFYLSEFVEMDVTSPPDPAEFTSRLALMHKLSTSPTGKFGFHVRTCDGDRAHVVDWQESWAVFYRNLFLGVCELDLRRNGPWPEYERAIHQIAWKVIPRLLEPLQAGGRKLKPCIIHGDLWEGNMGINMETGDSLLFDAGSYFAHNEMELGHWRCEFSSVFRAKVYTRHYLRHYPAAEPAEEFDDRIRLYSLKGAINYSAGHAGSGLRRTAYNNMCYLCEKYAPIDGIDAYDPLIDPSLTGACIVPHLADGLI